MNQFFNNKRMIVLLISVIVFISTIAISRNREEASIPQLFINDMAGISTSILSKPAETVSSFVDSVDHLVHTFEENQALKKKVDAMDEMQAKIYALEQENQNMKQELVLNNNLTEFKKISSTVIARNPDNWIDLIVIDKGSNDGIQVDMSVMSGNGLIGRVSEVSPTMAKVLLLSTPNDIANRVSAEIQNPKESIHGIIDGYNHDKKLFIMSEIDPTKEIETGSQVVTSGLGGVSPSSLLIGTVEEVKMDEFGLFQEVLIKPAGNMYDIRYVTVIVRQSKGD
ncbi:rod shape-determining protein MreC [Jeotgalibaca sp. MA1X17-3]|uniref:rod shape-determining protein MreC n=1 Tax=Jeotgalibaca sp. MA1X17-3 TaxID=2908211 RepID=UPI001F245647|nr:rod shape-determining protein MreC [Jeotgalibaca sp. MA1X17-3]UJF15046.1 rod shape-determining protein MreC [Jeotgalibaca sp. MA1X17-3]